METLPTLGEPLRAITMQGMLCRKNINKLLDVTARIHGSRYLRIGFREPFDRLSFWLLWYKYMIFQDTTIS